MPNVLLLALLACSEYNFEGTPERPELGPEDPEPEGDGTGDGVALGEGGVSGRICAPDGETWVVGADVWVELDDGTRVATVTDGDGRFVLDGLPPGTYTVFVQKGSFTTEFVVEVSDGEVTELAYEECLSQDDVTIAVVSGAYDSIEAVLDRMGIEYTLIQGHDWSGTAQDHVTLLRTPVALEQYDIIFFDCGMDDTWLPYRGEIASNVRDFVRNGGSVYTSDWAYFLAENAYPDMVEFVGDDAQSGAAALGVAGSVYGEVVDPHMIIALGSDQAELWYDLDVWITPERIGNGDVLIRGQYNYYGTSSSYWYSYDFETGDGPLAARRHDGDGQIVFTSFHNERQTTFAMDVLLEEIVLSL